MNIEARLDEIMVKPDCIKIVVRILVIILQRFQQKIYAIISVKLQCKTLQIFGFNPNKDS